MSVFTDLSKLLYALAWLAGTGFYNCLWFSLASVLFPRKKTGFSVSKAVFGSPPTVPGEFLESGEFPPSRFLQRIEQAVSGFAVPLANNFSPAPPAPLPAALLAAKFVFVREDASVPPLAPLNHSPYLVLERCTKFFRLQLDDRMDVVSVDRLKPAFSVEPISPALPPLQLPPPQPAVV